MSEVTKPIALNESFNTTENTPRNIADVIADNGDDLITQAQAIATKLQALINAVKPNASDIPLAPITGMNADDVQEGISELKDTLTNFTPFTVTIENAEGTSDCVIDSQLCYTRNKMAYIAVTLHSVNNTSAIRIRIPDSIGVFKQSGAIGVCGKGTRWSVTEAQYVYIASNMLALNSIFTNKYYHVLLTLPIT